MAACSYSGQTRGGFNRGPRLGLPTSRNQTLLDLRRELIPQRVQGLMDLSFLPRACWLHSPCKGSLLPHSSLRLLATPGRLWDSRPLLATLGTTWLLQLSNTIRVNPRITGLGCANSIWACHTADGPFRVSQEETSPDNFLHKRKGRFCKPRPSKPVSKLHKRKTSKKVEVCKTSFFK